MEANLELIKGLMQAVSQRVCPKCGSKMAEVDRVVENGFSYVWYECMGAGCNEQFLDKRRAAAGF